MKGIKRHIVVDTLGLLLSHRVTAASTQDRDGAPDLISKLRGNFGRLKIIWADGGYSGKLEKAMSTLLPKRGVQLDIVRKPKGVKGFTLLPKRWMVERTFSWMMGHRRLCCHYEHTASSAEALMQIAMIRLMLRRVRKSL